MRSEKVIAAAKIFLVQLLLSGTAAPQQMGALEALPSSI
jgi:hypothetical protein